MSMTSAQDYFDMVAGSGNKGIQFDGKDFPNWKYAMETLLLRQGVLDIVRGTTTRPTGDDAMMRLLQTLTAEACLPIRRLFSR